MKIRVLKKDAIKAYKAFDSELTCNGFKYEIGNSYHHKGEVELCKKGFHACTLPVDCFTYYPFRISRFAEVLLWGDVRASYTDSKLVASNIKIVRELDYSEVYSLVNLGERNTGKGNIGDANTGAWNRGSWNTWNGNEGMCNTSYGNTGNHNTGHSNNGSNNSGNYNCGSYNVGFWNKGDGHTGWFNTKQEPVYMFNKRVSRQRYSHWYIHEKPPAFLDLHLTEWVPWYSMTEVERKDNPEHEITGGYLRVLKYKEAFRKSFEYHKKQPDWPEQLKQLKAIPNFDFAVFEEISGISKEELEGEE